jgi:sec-independent protein translocase protein TatA
MMNLGLMPLVPHMPSLGSLLVIAFIGLLVFGKRLPEVGKSLGKGIVEFKKGLRGIEDDIDEAVDRKPTERALPRAEAHERQTAEAARQESEKSRVS